MGAYGSGASPPRRPVSLLVVLASLIACSACAHARIIDTPILARSLVGTDGATHPLRPAPNARLAVLFFFANHCPCQAAHDRRLRDLYALYHPRGVDVMGVDSEIGATVDRDAGEVARRRYPFPILLDPGGALAHGVGAEYATESYVLDRNGIVRYHGGIDSDRKTLHDDATPFLGDALDDLLADRPLRRAEGKALGCALQMW
jgi:peroxiredoxin